MHYTIQVVEDHQLPPQNGWVFVRSGDDQFMLIKRSLMAAGSLVLAEALSNAWRAWMVLAAIHRLPIAG